MKNRYAEALTPREREVIELLSTGCTNEEIARQLGISLDGVKYHVSGIFRSLRVKNRHEAASLHLGTEGGVLTPRELEVIELLSTGLTNEEIARQLGISLDGVKYHVSGILRRLDVENRREAASFHLRTARSGRLAALAPLMFLRKLPFGWLGKAAAGGALTTAAAGIALLAWGVMSTSTATTTTPGRNVEQRTGNAAPGAPSVAQAAAGPDAISAGGFHTCALRNGVVWCWGTNTNGQLGNNSTTDSPVPVTVSGLESGVSSISTGSDNTCALKDGGVWCWGGVLVGARETGGTLVPLVVPGLGRGVSAISAGTGCAIQSDAVWCWPFRTNPGQEVVPEAVSGLAGGVSAVSGTCALKDGGVWCWGSNWAGQLGNNSTTDSDVPVAVSVSGLTTGVSAISAVGDGHICALKDGGVWCWGWNRDGQLGNDSTTDSPVPVTVSELTTGVSAISAGWYLSCALKDGGVWCWGSNSNGQLGNDSTTDSPVPVAVSGLASGVSSMSAGKDHACALKGDGVWCWGRNAAGQLGNNSTTDSSVPVRILFPPASAGDTAAAPAAQPSPSHPATDSADHRTAYVLGGSAAAALAIVAASMWAVWRRRSSEASSR